MNASNLKTEKIRFLYRGSPLQLIAGGMTGLIMVAVHWAAIPRLWLLGWLLVFGGIMAGRGVLIALYRRALARQERPDYRWLGYFRLASLVAGLIWGAGGVILSQSGDPGLQSFVAFGMAGVSAGAITAMSIDRKTTLFFMVPTLAPLALMFLLEPGGLTAALGLVVLIFLFFLAVTAARIESYLLENARLRLRAEAQKGLIETSETRLRFALEGTGQGLWDWDMETNRVYYSPQWKALLGYDEEQIGSDLSEWRSRVHPDDWGMAVTAMQRHRKGKTQLYEVELRIRCRDGNYKWVMNHGQIIERGADGTPRRMIGLQTDISERKAAQQAIQRFAFYDALTGLPNRRLLLDRMEHALTVSERSRRFGALLFIDLDRFKELNDSQGHAVGDLLLQEVARRLSASIREVDTVARLGGDEFVVMLEDLSEDAEDAEHDATEVGYKILASLGVPYTLGEHRHHGTPSIGVILFLGRQDSANELLARADLAMYRAKHSGRNRVCFFDPSMQVSVDTRSALRQDLKTGVEEGHFVLHYQPEIDRSGRIVSAEALLRWTNPRRQAVTTSEFVTLAEESGLMTPLGYWVLESACAQLQAWSAQPEWTHVTLSVNISDRLFRDPHFVERVLAILERTGADPRQLRLELKESLLSRDVTGMIDRMKALQSRGVRLTLDNFGAGDTSLGALRRLPLDRLKLDRSLTRDLLTDPQAAAIATSLIALGDALGLEVIAAGVETREQQAFLEGLACHGYQGYLFGQPLSLKELSQSAAPRTEVAQAPRTGSDRDRQCA